jgi:hypothetical protein
MHFVFSSHFLELKKMENEAEKKFFRLQHIIPRSLSAASVKVSAGSSPIRETVSANATPEEFVYKMTYGNVAGIRWFVFVHQILNSVTNFLLFLKKKRQNLGSP